MAAWDQVPLSSPASLFAGQPDYARTMFDIIAAPGNTLRANQQSDRDYAAKLQELADQRAYQAGSLDIQKQRLANDIAGNSGTYGTLYYSTDKQGNKKAYVIDKQGNRKEVPLPGGETWANKGIPHDMGTYIEWTDPYTGQVLERSPKDIRGAESEKKIGEGLGAAAVNLPGAEAATDRMIRSIDDVLNDASLDTITGPLQGRIGPITGAQEAAQAKLDLVKGQTFLQAYNDLRGAGAITEKEGEAAMAAYSRLNNQRQDSAAYRQALQDLRAEVTKLLDIARRKAAGTTVPAPPEPPPPPGAPPPPSAPPGNGAGAPPPPPPGFKLDQ